MRLLLIITLLFSTLNAQNREALLIGNSNYKYISNLKDTSQNLSRLEATLKKIGFTVKVKNNLEAKKLKEAIDNFKERLAKSHDTIGFLYYSGHGCQMDNVGYLIPTNVNSSKSLDVKYDALNIDKMLETLREAGNRVNMVFLDACRDNTPTGKKGGKKGLAQAPVMPKGTLVVYATEATKTADDNSNFINALIAQIKQPNRSIRDIGYNISDDVASQTGEQQVPQVFAQRVPNVVLSSISTSKWIKPSDSVCKANGGKLYKGVCEANWKNAKKICLASGGKLPTLNDFKEKVVFCGGVWENRKKNHNNTSYQSCYKQKGFFSFCWTSEKKSFSKYLSPPKYFVWGVDFDGGKKGFKGAGGIANVLCVSEQ